MPLFFRAGGAKAAQPGASVSPVALGATEKRRRSPAPASDLCAWRVVALRRSASGHHLEASLAEHRGSITHLCRGAMGPRTDFTRRFEQHHGITKSAAEFRHRRRDQW